MPDSASYRFRASKEEPFRLLERFRRTYRPYTTVLDGVEWDYWDLGRGPQTILFLHGLAGSGDIWFQQLLSFAPSYRVLAPTYPPLQPLEQLVTGVWRLMDRLQIGRAQVVGSSLGGLVAQHMATHHPERVERAVFSNTFPPGHPDVQRGRWMLQIARLLPEPTVFAIMKRSLRKRHSAFEPGERLLRSYLLEQYEGGMTRSQLLARIACVFGDFDLASPEMPHAIIESLDEPLLSRNVRSDLKRLYPRAWVYTFKRGGHFPYLSQPDEYNRALTSFLNASYI